ncbi:hypothetical protein SDC9_185325 [bioreactor metagenome]|uniref:Uncharacterized protein n=1 Tax=bioreactor metagenome TaxID=1076179 RepID=A0A645HNW7_9ZZZZ
MLEGLHQGSLVVGILLGGVGQSAKIHFIPVVQQILPKQHGMVALFHGLDLEPVFKAIQTIFGVETSDVQIQVGREKFFVNLLVQQFHDVFIQHIQPLFHGCRSGTSFCSAFNIQTHPSNGNLQQPFPEQPATDSILSIIL